MEAVNIAVVRGVVSSEPRVRELPSGSIVTNVEVTSDLGHGRMSVPVVLHDGRVQVTAGDEVVVVGHVRRRFYRAGGSTQSRTEVVAEHLLRATQRRRIERALERVIERLSRVAG